MGDRLACVVLPCLSLWYEPSWGVDYAMRKNVSDVSVDVSDVSEVYCLQGESPCHRAK